MRPPRALTGFWQAGLLFGLLQASVGLSAELEPLPLEQRLVDLHLMIAPAVVRVNFLYEDSSGKGVPTKGVFSGFFVSRDGKVLTNIGGAGRVSRVWVEKDGLSFLAEILGSDTRTNIALLQVVKLPEHFEIIPIHIREDPLPLGTLVFGLTIPLELESSPALGLVSGYESNFADVVFPFTYTRINIPVGNGEGGSPVVDLQGKLVGIAVASLPDVRSSYLVPAKALPRILEDLTNLGSVSYGALPIEFSERPDATNTTRQVVVASVAANSSAGRADVRTGDVVRRLGASTIRRINDIRDAIFYAKPGQFISLEVERAGKRIPFALPVEQFAEAAPTPPPAGNEVVPTSPTTRPFGPPTRPGSGE